MSKELDALKHIYLTATDRTNALCVMDYETIQKELKALEIIKEECLLDIYVYQPMLPKEKFDLLKEVLKDE